MGGELLENADQRAIAREEAFKKQTEKLKGERRDLKQRLFGRKSEKGTGRSERGDGPRIEKAPARPRGQQRHSSGHGRTILAHLPIEEARVELSEDNRCCAQCGLPDEPLPGTKSSEGVELEVRAYRRRYLRARYRRGCQCEGEREMVTAPPPTRLIAKGKVGLSFWVAVVVDKFLYGRATHRLIQERKSHGLPVSQGTVSGGLKGACPLV